MRLDSVKRILSEFFNDGIDTAGLPVFEALRAFTEGGSHHLAQIRRPASAITFTRVGTSAFVISIGATLPPADHRSRSWLATIAIKPQKPFAWQMKIRFTCCAHFPRGLVFANTFVARAAGFELGIAPCKSCSLALAESQPSLLACGVGAAFKTQTEHPHVQIGWHVFSSRATRLFASMIAIS